MVRRALANDNVTEPQQAQYELWNQEAVRLNDAIKKTKIKEKSKGINYSSGEDEGSDSDRETTIIEEDKKLKKNKERKERRGEDDDISNQIYQAQNPFFSAFTYKTNALYDGPSEGLDPPQGEEKKKDLVPPQGEEKKKDLVPPQGEEKKKDLDPPQGEEKKKD